MGRGFWEAVREVWPATREQRDWCHKMANVLDKLPKRLQGRAKRALHEIMYAETRAQAERGIEAFVAEFSPKYEKAVDCLIKDREALLAFFDFPAEHWKHIRTANPIESTFATVRLRTARTKGCLSRDTALAMVFKLAQSAERHWRRLDGASRLGQLIEGIKFRDGEADKRSPPQAAGYFRRAPAGGPRGAGGRPRPASGRRHRSSARCRVGRRCSRNSRPSRTRHPTAAS